MPVSFLSSEQRENYGRYTGVPSPRDLARYFHLDDADHALIARKRGVHNRLGYAVQLGTVRYLSTFLENPMAAPAPVLQALAKQLRIQALDGVHAYSTGEQTLGTRSRNPTPLRLCRNHGTPSWFSPDALALCAVLDRHRSTQGCYSSAPSPGW